MLAMLAPSADEALWAVQTSMWTYTVWRSSLRYGSESFLRRY
jgi:hypothetical protein